MTPLNPLKYLSSTGRYFFIVGNIFFVGLMGAGKTTVGRLVAKHLNKEFYDSDHEIERRTGVNIPLIFELEGEVGFRRRESAVIDGSARATTRTGRCCRQLTRG